MRWDFVMQVYQRCARCAYSPAAVFVVGQNDPQPVGVGALVVLVYYAVACASLVVATRVGALHNVGLK